MIRCKSALPLVILGTIALAFTVSMPLAGDEPPTRNQPNSAATDGVDQPPKISPEQIKAWVEDLDSDMHAVRQAAVKKLIKAGPIVITAISKVALEGTPEAKSRAILVLRQLYLSEDAKVREPAKAAMEKLAAGDDSSIAPRAKEALKAKRETEKAAQRNARNRVFPGGAIRGARIQIGGIQIFGGAGVRSISIRNINGQKEISVVENNRRINIQVDPKGAIRMQVTEKDKRKTSEYKAKSAEELKKNHPDAYKIYKQYAQGGAGVIGNIQIAPGRIRIGPKRRLPGQKKKDEKKEDGKKDAQKRDADKEDENGKLGQIDRDVLRAINRTLKLFEKVQPGAVPAAPADLAKEFRRQIEEDAKAVDRLLERQLKPVKPKKKQAEPARKQEDAVPDAKDSAAEIRRLQKTLKKEREAVQIERQALKKALDSHKLYFNTAEKNIKELRVEIRKIQSERDELFADLIKLTDKVHQRDLKLKELLEKIQKK